MRIEILCHTSEELQEAIRFQEPTGYKYLRVNKKDVRLLTFAEQKNSYHVTYEQDDKKYITSFHKPDARMQVLFNKRKTKATITLVGPRTSWKIDIK